MLKLCTYSLCASSSTDTDNKLLKAWKWYSVSQFHRNTYSCNFGEGASHTCAHLFIGGVWGVTTRVAYLGGIDPFFLPKLPLRSPETAHTCFKKMKIIKKCFLYIATDQNWSIVETEKHLISSIGRNDKDSIDSENIYSTCTLLMGTFTLQMYTLNAKCIYISFSC